MRCIEMECFMPFIFQRIGLIETWDVLKYNLTNYIVFDNSINRNMRCIEMLSREEEKRREVLINRNMRCIEIIILLR